MHSEGLQKSPMPHNTQYAVRVVPSGQIYRQLFDAQLQLNKSLSSFDSESRIQRLRSKKLSHSQSLPLFTLNQEETQHGILNRRQKTWVEGFPNDPYTENPVLYKQYNEFLNQKLQDTKTCQAGWEVRSLPDVVVSAKQDSDILERIVKSRRQRHESMLEDMHQALSQISIETEPLIMELIAVLIDKLAVSDEEIANVQVTIENDKDLLAYKRSDLFALWEKIQTHTSKRKNWIAEMNSSLQKIETVRMNKIREVFMSYGKRLQSLSYLLLPDLQRLMDRESQMINQTVLSNHRLYADLYVRLIAADVERERIQHNAFLRKVEDWKILNTQMIVENFKKFMKTKAIIQPPGIETVLINLWSEEKVLNTQRLQIIKTLCDMQPPNSTMRAVYTWSEDLIKLSEELDSVMQMHMSKLHKEYEQVCQQCLENVDNMKLAMIDAGICSSHKANHVVDEFMLPLVGKQQRVFEKNIEYMQRIIEEHRVNMEKKITKLFKFAKEAAQLWDIHSNRLTKQEEELHDRLKESREQHDQIFQEKEANLDIMMDRMRQEAGEMTLKDSLLKALSMLDKIRESYEDFHGLQTRIVKTYPTMVKEELVSYEKTVYNFFSVSRVLPALLQDDGDDDKASDETEIPMNDSDQAQMNVNNTKTIEELTIPQVHNARLLVKEIIHTSKGTEFYVLQDYPDWFVEEKGLEGKDTDSHMEQTFLTNEKDNEDSFEFEAIDIQGIIQAIDIPNSLFLEIKNTICIQFLEHLDGWSEQAMLRANSILIAKCEELNSELDLRLHLHQPRPHRAELDIHNVRAAELVLHAERMTRQYSGVEQCLTELGLKFKAMSQEHSKLANKFKEDIEALEEVFVSATKSARLVKLQNQVTIELNNFMSVIRSSLRQFRHHLDETLQTLRESNARFINSFRLFSDGGNFCPEEITVYRKKLDKISLMIDSTEGSIMSELEGMESKHLESATKIVVDFEDRLKNHMSDLSFLECIDHWLSNTHVKIKSEVAKCNMQAQRLDQMLNDLQHKVTACEKPHFDKEQITVTQLNDTLSSIFDAFVRHSEYLHCGKILNISADDNGVTGAIKAANEVSFEKELKVGFTHDRKSSRGANDPPAGLIKTIFKCIELSKGKSLEEQWTQATKKGLVLNPELDTNDFAWGKKSFMPQTSTGGSDSSKSIQKGTDITREVAPKKSFSGRMNKPTKSDKKSLVFGEKFENYPDGKQDDFLVSIQHTLGDALDTLLATAEVFYNLKGTRPATRPQAIPETFEQCTEIILQKTQSYFYQSDEYQNKCLQDFHGQITRLEQLCSCVPSLVIADLLNGEIQKSIDFQIELSKRFNITLCQFTESQKSIQKKLRTTLGHPHFAESLSVLCAQEKVQHNEYLEAVTQHVKERQECALEHARVFLDHLVKLTELQLQQYDSMLIVDDIEKGRLEPKQYPLCELLRYQKVEKPLQDQENKDSLPRGQASWIGVPSNQFVAGDKPDVLELTPIVQTCKTSIVHFATVKARDKAYEDYKEYFERCLHQIEAMGKKLITSETNSNKSWETSVKKVTSLYKQSE